MAQYPAVDPITGKPIIIRVDSNGDKSRRNPLKRKKKDEKDK